MIGPDGAAGFVVGSTCTKVMLDFTQFSPGSFFFNPPYVVDACISHEVAYMMPALTFDKSLSACGLSGIDPAGCPATQQRCVPRPQGDFTHAICIYQNADVATCPQPFGQKLVYGSYTDSRSCTDCTCTATNLSCVADGATDMSVAYYDSATQQCDFPTYVIPQSPNCKTRDSSSSTTVYMKLQNAKAVAAGTPSCQAGGGLVEGSISLSQTVTFCCWTSF
jgi:hypothetical protein